MKPGSNKARREAAKRLALKLQSDYRGLVEASGTDEVQAAAIALGATFNANIEFVINVLRDYGGLEAKFEPLTRKSPSLPPKPANDLPDISALTKTFSDACTCPPMEVGIIGYAHMTSCPQFVPAK